MAIRAPAQHVFPLLYVTVDPKGTLSAQAEKKAEGLSPMDHSQSFLEVFFF
jgi:hypothetical protein